MLCTFRGSRASRLASLARRRSPILLAITLLAVGCGGGDGSGKLTVLAASSLTDVLQQLAPGTRFEFAGSDTLAAQLREGAKADVYAAASTRYPAELYAEGLVEKPVVFATNRLVLIVPADNPAGISSVSDLRRPGIRLVIGAEGVPVGDYTRKALARLGETEALAQAVSEEQDVKGIVSKVALGEADAGFVYATDVRSVAGEVQAIELPAGAEAHAIYAAAVVTGAKHHREAERFLALLRSEQGRSALREAGFGLP